MSTTKNMKNTTISMSITKNMKNTTISMSITKKHEEHYHQYEYY